MTDTWISAARKYECPPIPEPALQTESPAKDLHRVHAPSQDEIDTLTRELSLFLEGDEGVAALALLKASNRHINLGEEEPMMGYGNVYFLDGTGLHRSQEAMGMWTAYSRANAPVLSVLPVEEAVRLVSRCDYPSTSLPNMMDWLRKQLDSIAAHAPA